MKMLLPILSVTFLVLSCNSEENQANSETSFLGGNKDPYSTAECKLENESFIYELSGVFNNGRKAENFSHGSITLINKSDLKPSGPFFFSVKKQPGSNISPIDENGFFTTTDWGKAKSDLKIMVENFNSFKIQHQSNGSTAFTRPKGNCREPDRNINEKFRFFHCKNDDPNDAYIYDWSWLQLDKEGRLIKGNSKVVKNDSDKKVVAHGIHIWKKSGNFWLTTNDNIDFYVDRFEFSNKRLEVNVVHRINGNASQTPIPLNCLSVDKP